MRIKNLFTIPTEEKVTEKALRRVLISSVCSILLCMICLVGTTWAWFTVSVENTGNVIEIAAVTADASITPSENTEAPIQNDDGSYLLVNGKYTISVVVDDNADTLDAFGNKHPVYVAIVISDDCYYFQFGGSETKTVLLTVHESPVKLSFGSASWVKPENAVLIEMETIVVGEEPVEETTEPSTEATEPSTEATEPSTESTQDSGGTQ